MSNSLNQYRKYTEKYGEDTYQEGDLYIPNKKVKAVVCLFHGGFWRMPYDRFQFNEISKKIALNGFIVWNIEYRRIGASGGGWTGTFDDAVDSINILVDLQKKYKELDLSTIYIAGHSAGGHLALWLGKYGNGVSKNKLKIKPKTLIGLAPVINLQKAFEIKSGNNSVYELVKNTPTENPEKYKRCSPIEMLPIGIEQLIIHGTNDEYLPLPWTTEYVKCAQEAEDKIDLIEIKNGGHMDFVDPHSKGIAIFCDWLSQKYQ